MYHPMTGKKTRLKIHWYSHHGYDPYGVRVEVACGIEIINGHSIYCDNINDITCLKCMDIATRPDLRSTVLEESY